MIIKRPAILSLKIVIVSLPFILGAIAQAWADLVKSINNTANQEIIMKMDENKGVIQKKNALAKGPIRSSKNRNIRFYKGISYSDYGAIMGGIRPDVNPVRNSRGALNPTGIILKSNPAIGETAEWRGIISDGVNFVKTLEEKKKPRLRDSLDKVIYSCEFSKDVWKDKFLTFRGIAEAKSSNSGSDHSVLKPYPNGNKYFEEGRILTTFKLLQSKREELFKEVSMGFRFSFQPMSGHMFLEMNVTPASETGRGIIIPF